MRAARFVKYTASGKRRKTTVANTWVVRSTYLIDSKGIVAKAWSNVRVKEHVKNVFKGDKGPVPMRTDYDVIGEIVGVLEQDAAQGPCGKARRSRLVGRRYPGYWVYCPHPTKRPKRPELLQPKDMQRRGRAQTKEDVLPCYTQSPIELNAIDLAADILCVFPMRTRHWSFTMTG